MSIMCFHAHVCSVSSHARRVQGTGRIHCSRGKLQDMGRVVYVSRACLPLIWTCCHVFETSRALTACILPRSRLALFIWEWEAGGCPINTTNTKASSLELARVPVYQHNSSPGRWTTFRLEGSESERRGGAFPPRTWKEEHLRLWWGGDCLPPSCGSPHLPIHGSVLL